MALPQTVTKEEFEKLPEVVRDHYSEDKGTFYLKLVPKEKLDEFRSNNIALLRERDELKTQAERYKDLDPEKAREALAKLTKLDEKKLIDEGKVDELVTQRTGAMKADLEKKLTAAEKERELAHARLSELLIDNSLRETALKPDIAARASALTDIVLRAKTIWALNKESKPVAMKDGNVLYGKDGQPLTMTEWLTTLRADAPHLFEESSGGGASNDKGGALKSTKKRSEMSVAEKTEFISKHGRTEYEKLPY